MIQEKTFGQKFFEFHERVQKCHFAKIEKLPIWHFLSMHEIQKTVLAESLLLKHYECPRFRSVKVKTENFNPKEVTAFQKLLLFWVSMNT